jgi:anti-sigma factor RsiW
MQSVEKFHLQDEQLERYSLGRLRESELEALEEHLLICAHCQDKLAEVDAYVTAMKSAALKLQDRPPSLWDRVKALVPDWFTSPLPAGAALAVAVLVIALLLVQPWDSGSNGMAPATVVLQALRGAEQAGVAPAGQPLELRLHFEDRQAAASYRVAVVNATGGIVWEGTPELKNEYLALTIDTNLPAGAYWVRLHEADSGSLLREYPLHLR